MALALSPAEAVAFLPVAATVGAWVMVSDLREMRIPNRAVLALLAAFIVIGAFLLPLDALAWRLGQGLAVLAIGFILNMIGLLGAGDAKFAAAMAPFIAPADALLVLMVFAGLTAVSLVLHRLALVVPGLKARLAKWASWQRLREFPMGVPLALTLIVYLALGLGTAGA